MASVRARNARWSTAADLLALVRRESGITRAAAARRLDLTSGSATEIAARLRETRLLTETTAATSGRGRPTFVLRPHPEGPLVVAVEVRYEGWQCAVAAVDGLPMPLASGRHVSLDPGPVLDAVRDGIRTARHRFGDRIRAVSASVAGTVSDGRLVQSSSLGWGSVDLTGLGEGLPFLVGNDATLAGVAETRTGSATGSRTALHLLIENGVGGAVTVDGRPVVGTTGAGGEYGHLPFGDRNLSCPCGARGCWDLEIGGRAIARRRGDPPPADPRRYVREILERDAGSVIESVSALGSGVAGLVNAHDPDLVTLGGLAIPLRAAAPAEFAAAYADGLMSFRRDRPPPVVDAAHGDDGALRGAIQVGLDHITAEPGLAAWADHVRKGGS
jgi:predicted NBD/HSP70 family sugar kinase